MVEISKYFVAFSEYMNFMISLEDLKLLQTLKHHESKDLKLSTYDTGELLRSQDRTGNA